MYSTNLTKTEKRLGYKISQMPNPELPHIGAPVMVDAVIYQLDETNIIVKMDGLDGTALYSQQRLRSESAGEQDNWKAVGSRRMKDPAAAIEVARGIRKIEEK